MLILIRRYNPGSDDNPILNLLCESRMSTVNKFFYQVATREVTAQIALMMAAVFFVLLGLPLISCLTALPITIALLYLVVFGVHWQLARKVYKSNSLEIDRHPKGAVFVAEVFDQKDHHKIEFIFQKEQGKSKIKGLIVGTISVGVKRDPDMKEPPESVAWIKDLSVTKRFRRKGIADRLLDAAIRHCLIHNFRAVEVVANQCHEHGRTLLVKKGFDILHCYKKDLVFGLASVSMYRMRLPCILKRSLLNT